MSQEPTAWESLDWWRLEGRADSRSTQVDDVYLAQPIGFVWHSKPRYRVKAKTRKVEK